MTLTCQTVPAFGCSICGDNKCTTKPDAPFSFPGEPAVLCGSLQAAGYAGFVPLSQCPFLPALVNDICGCQEDHTRGVNANLAPAEKKNPQSLVGAVIFLGVVFFVLVPGIICFLRRGSAGKEKEIPEIMQHAPHVAVVNIEIT